jgi:hypothetical protein
MLLQVISKTHVALPKDTPVLALGASVGIVENDDGWHGAV